MKVLPSKIFAVIFRLPKTGNWLWFWFHFQEKLSDHRRFLLLESARRGISIILRDYKQLGCVINKVCNWINKVYSKASRDLQKNSYWSELTSRGLFWSGIIFLRYFRLVGLFNPCGPRRGSISEIFRVFILKWVFEAIEEGISELFLLSNWFSSIFRFSGY